MVILRRGPLRSAHGFLIWLSVVVLVPQQVQFHLISSTSRTNCEFDFTLICYHLLLNEDWLLARCICGLQSAHCRQEQGQDLWQGCKRRLRQQAEGDSGYDHPAHDPEQCHMLAFGMEVLVLIKLN